MAATTQQPLELDIYSKVTAAVYRACRSKLRVRVLKMSLREYAELHESMPACAYWRGRRCGSVYGATIRIVPEDRWTS